MSDLNFNKFAGAVLATGLAIVGLSQLSAGVFAPDHAEKMGYLVEVAEETGGGPGGEENAPIDWGTVLPTANIAAGEAAFAKCVSCHNVAQGGANGTGPNLWAVVGKRPAAVPGFAYSPALQSFAGEHPVWDYEQLNLFLAAPQKYVAGTKMTFVGLKKPEDRINMIAYLRAQGGTLPIPAPNPAAAATDQPPAPSGPEGAETPAPGAASEGEPTATGSTATPATGAGGPAGQGAGAPSPGAPTQMITKPGNPNSSGRGSVRPSQPSPG